ncbi:MAG: S46 family peptidase, partial [Bacteroidia bacterium]|nr:S46 family peptidase [Bacteroidia bacterium]
MKKLTFIISLSLLYTLSAIADEGMWIPLLLKQLNEPQMKKLGMRLSAEDIYSINNGSLKDAIIQFGGGCTGEIVSENGLLLTNHHCGYGAIQSHSKVGKNYLDDGFWAKNYGEELPNPGLTALFIVRIEDVTARTTKGVLTTMTEQERDKLIAENTKQIETDAVKGTKYEAKVRSFFYGNEYYLFVTQTFKDVRLVGTPPQSIGKFGGDTDNWMWPRHTGDFSVFRIYADENNEPADYSPNNKPYKPKRFLNISLKPLKEGDFTLTYGFPGITYEYLTSYGVEQVVKVSNPIKIKLRETRLNIWQADMRADEATRIMYSSKYAQIANYYKKFQGENRGIRLFNGIERKQNEEKDFQKWANGKPEYENILKQFKDIYDKANPYRFVSDITLEGFLAPEALRFAWGFNNLLTLAKEAETTGNSEKFNKEAERLKGGIDRFYKDYNPSTDRKIFPALIKLYNDNLQEKYASQFILDFRNKQKSD